MTNRIVQHFDASPVALDGYDDVTIAARRFRILYPVFMDRRIRDYLRCVEHTAELDACDDDEFMPAGIPALAFMLRRFPTLVTFRFSFGRGGVKGPKAPVIVHFRQDDLRGHYVTVTLELPEQATSQGS
jgi:hypothetical protein